MYAYRTRFVTDGKPRLELELPPEFPQGRQKVEVVVMVDEPRVTPEETDGRDLLAWLDTLPPGPHSETEIESWIEEERNAWGDD